MSNMNQNITNECTEDVDYMSYAATLPGHSQSMSNMNQNIANECTKDAGPATLPDHSHSIVNVSDPLSECKRSGPSTFYCKCKRCSKRPTKIPHPYHKPKLLLQYAQEKGWSEAKIQQWERRLIKRKEIKAVKKLEKKKMKEQMSAENAIGNSGPYANTTLPVRRHRPKLEYARAQRKARRAEKRLIDKALDQMCAAELPDCTPQERNRLEAKIAEILKITVKRRDRKQRKAERGLIDETLDQMCAAEWSDSTPQERTLSEGKIEQILIKRKAEKRQIYKILDQMCTAEWPDSTPSSQTTNGNAPCGNIPPTENEGMDQQPILNSSQLTSDHTTMLYRQDRIDANKNFRFISMVIIKEDYPVDRLSYKEGQTIKKTIINLVDNLDEGAQRPRIRSEAWRNDGSLCFRCDDSYTVDWLISTFDENENVLLGTRLCVAKASDLYNKIVSFTTEDLHTTKASVLLERIEKCNPKLQSSRWEALYSVIKGEFRVWVLEVSEGSSKAIREAGFKADSGVDKGVFKFLSVKEESVLRTALYAAVSSGIEPSLPLESPIYFIDRTGSLSELPHREVD